MSSHPPSAAPPAPANPDDSELSTLPSGAIAGGTAEDHALLGILASMSQSGTQHRPPSATSESLPSPFLPFPSTSSLSSNGHPISLPPIVPSLFPSFPHPAAPRPPSQSHQLYPLLPSHPQPLLPPAVAGLKSPFHLLHSAGDDPSSIEGSRETSLDAEGETEPDYSLDLKPTTGDGTPTEGGTPKGRAAGTGGAGGAKGRRKGKATVGAAGIKTEDGAAAGGAGGPAEGQTEVDWLRARKDNHKEVERRRRETINEGINELKLIVPNCDKNKGSILASAVKYIQELKAHLGGETGLGDEGRREEMERLRTENERLRARVMELEGRGLAVKRENGVAGVGEEQGGEMKRPRMDNGEQS